MIERNRILEWRDFFPNTREPTLLLVVGDRASRNVFDGGFGDVVTENGVVGADVFAANDAAEDGEAIASKMIMRTDRDGLLTSLGGSSIRAGLQPALPEQSCWRSSTGRAPDL